MELAYLRFLASWQAFRDKPFFAKMVKLPASSLSFQNYLYFFAFLAKANNIITLT